MTTIAITAQVDLSGNPFGTAFTATDVTDSGLAGQGYSPIQITWGRQDQYSQVTPTSVSGVLQNVDGTYTPGNALADPNFRRGMRRRYIATVSATDVNLAEDYATALEAIPDQTLWTTEIDGSDILARLSGTPSSASNQVVPGTSLRSFLAEEMLLDAPSALYMFQEPEGSTSFADVTGANGPATIVDSKYGAGVVDAGQQPTSTWYGGNMVSIANDAYGTWTSGTTVGSWIQLPELALAPSTLEIWVEMPTGPPAPGVYGCILAQVDGPGSGAGSQPLIAVKDANLIYDNNVALSTPAPYDGGVHQIVSTKDGSNNLRLYLDGVEVALDTSTGFRAGQYIALGLEPEPWINGAVSPFSGAVAYVACFNSVLSAGRILDHYNAGANALAGESTDDRMARLLSYRPNTGSVLDSGLSTMGFQDIAGRSLTDCLLEVGQVENGAVFVDGQGQINFRSRSRLFNPTPVLTLDCSTGCVDFGSNFREDTQNVLNDVTVTATNGADQRFYDATSIGLDGEFSTSVGLPLDGDAAALSLAGWMVSNGTLRQLTVSPIIVNLITAPDAAVLGTLQLQPLDCVELTNIDVNATRAPATTMQFIAQGGQLSIGVDAASASLNVTPMPVAVAEWDSALWDDTPVWAF